MTAGLTRVRFSVEDYHRMSEIGILQEDDRVELIDGEIVSMAAVGSLHAGTVNRLNTLLVRTLGDRPVVAVQHPVQPSDDTEPEPDIAVLVPRSDFYAAAHPIPGDFSRRVYALLIAGLLRNLRAAGSSALRRRPDRRLRSGPPRRDLPRR